MKTLRRYLIEFSVGLVICVPSASAHAATPLLIITNRTLIDNEFIFGRNAASPPTLSKRIIDLTHRGVYGLSPADSVIKASTGIAGGIITGNPALTFTEVGDTGDTITRSGGTGAGSWLSDGFAVGQYIFVTNAGSNNIVRARLTNVTGTVLTLDSTDVAGGSSVSGATVRGGDRFVTVYNFGEASIYNGQRANTANITIDGNQPVPTYPQSDGTEKDLSPWGATYTADGIGLDGQLATVQNVLVHHCRGIGIAHQQGDGRVLDSEVYNCHTGIRVPSSDMEIRRCRIYACRDACLFLARDSGNIQSTDNHCYGSRIACYNEGAFPYRATGDTYADAWIGYFGSVYGIRTVITNVLFQHNTTRDCVFSNYACSLEACVVEVMRDVQTYNQFASPTALVPNYADKKVGVELDGENCSIRGGVIELNNWINEGVPHIVTGDGAEAIRVTADGCVIETDLRDSDTVNGSIGIRISGARKGLKVDCFVAGFDGTKDGFEGTNDRILKFTGTANNSQGLDITLRGDFQKNIKNDDDMPSETDGVEKYIDIATGTWTGTIRFINTRNGDIRVLTHGHAY
jgi:hypothetical protein